MMQVADQWLNAAKAELDGADPVKKLASTRGNIPVKPWYDRFDVQKDQSFILPAEKSWLGARSWVNAPLIKVKDATTANKNALHQLAAGADGILFELTEAIDPAVLLENIQLAYCSVYFKGNVSRDLIEGLFDFAVRGNHPSINGAAYDIDIAGVNEKFDGFRTAGFHLKQDDESTDVALAKLLCRFVEHFNSGNDVPRSMEQAAVLIETSNDFFLEIARLKALRVLWNGLCKAYKTNCSLMIHSQVAPWISESYQPHGNMIAATSRTLSAVLGGCNAATVIPEDMADDNTSRIARNVSLVLREESHISKTGDATAGAYYIDSLVREIVERSWTEFQRLQK